MDEVKNQAYKYGQNVSFPPIIWVDKLDEETDNPIYASPFVSIVGTWRICPKFMARRIRRLRKDRRRHEHQKRKQ